MIYILTIFILIINNFINNLLLIDNYYLLSSFLYIPLIVTLYPCFKTNKSYLLFVIIISIFVNNSVNFILNIGIFLLLYFIIIEYYKVIKMRILNIIILNNLIFIIYTLILGSILLLSYYNELNVYYVFKPFYNTLIINNIITIILFYCSKKIRQA